LHQSKYVSPNGAIPNAICSLLTFFGLGRCDPPVHLGIHSSADQFAGPAVPGRNARHDQQVVGRGLHFPESSVLAAHVEEYADFFRHGPF